MDMSMVDERRRLVSRQRSGPRPAAAGRLIRFPYDEGNDAAFDDPAPPVELHIEATDFSGDLAPWLNDLFWLDALQRWSGTRLSVHFLPTYESLLHPDLHAQVDMLRRVASGWRLVAYCYLSDLEVEGRLARAVMTLYHEIRIVDDRRPDCPTGDRPLTIETALGKMRQISAALRAGGRSVPVLARYKPADVPVAPSGYRERVSQHAGERETVRSGVKADDEAVRQRADATADNATPHPVSG
jgi:hypothetical protein